MISMHLILPVTILFSTSVFAADELVVTESGNVGIGINQPSSKLQVYGRKNPVPVRIGGNSEGNDFTMDVAAGQGLVNLVAGAIINTDGNGYNFLGTRGASRIMMHDGILGFYTSNSTSGTAGQAVAGLTGGQEKMRISANGNVGIGLTNPQAKLALNGGGIQLNGNYGIGFIGDIPENGNVSGDRAKIYYEPALIGDANDFLVIEKSDGNSADPDGGIAFTTKGNDNKRDIAMVIRGNNKVGIGTVNPAGKLHVAGNIRTDGNMEIRVDNANSQLKFHDPSHAHYSMGIDVADGRKFKLNYGGTVGETNHLAMTIDGRVGIGTSNPIDFIAGYGGGAQVPIKMHVAGNVKVDGIVYDNSDNSDARWKKNVTTIPDALQKVSQIRGVYYEWVDPSRSSAPQLGVIAQEVEAVFPELIYMDSEGYKSVEYKKLVAPLIEAVKALRDQNEQLAWENQVLKDKFNNIQLRLKALELR